ncbi:hypothetical protein Tco_1470677, partial [Tanacetum coccineum]
VKACGRMEVEVINFVGYQEELGEFYIRKKEAGSVFVLCEDEDIKPGYRYEKRWIS